MRHVLGCAVVVLLSSCGSGRPPIVTPPPTGAISGVVTVTGVIAPAGIVVTLAGPSGGATTADASGAYHFDTLGDGSYAVTATAPSTAPASITVPVAVANGAKTTATPIVLTALGSLSGTVTLAGATTGNAGTVVFLDGTGFSAATDDSGAWSLTGVPLGSDVPRASHIGFQTQAALAVNVEWAKNTAVPAIDLTANLSFRGDIIGSVSRVGLGPASGVAISVPNSMLATTSGDGGVFDLTGVPEGAFSLDFSDPPYVEHLPSVISLPGGDGFVIGDTGLVPLSTLELQRGMRLVTDLESFRVPSPDQSEVIFAELIPGSFYVCNLIRVSADGGTLLLASQVSCGARFTPDSSQFFFTTANGDLDLMSASGGAPTLVTHGGTELTFSPDGHQVAITSEPVATATVAQLALYDLGTGSLTVLSSNASAIPGGFALFSTDSQHLLFSADPTGNWGFGTVELADVSTHTVMAIDTGVYPTWCRFMPDQRSVLYLQLPGPDFEDPGVLKLAPLDGGAPVAIAQHAADFDLVVSPTGGELAFLDETNLMNFDNQGIVTVLPLDGGTPIAYSEGDGLQQVPGGFVYQQALGSYFSEPVIAHFDGTPLELFDLPDGGGRPEDFTVTGDGSHVLFVVNVVAAQGLWLFIQDRAGGAPVQLTDHMVDNYYFSPDGGQVLYIDNGNDAGNVLVLVDAHSYAKRTVGTDVTYASAQNFSTDGTQLTWTDSRGGLYIEPVNGTTPTQLSSALASGSYWLAPDGKNAAWIELDPASGSNVVHIGPTSGAPAIAALSHFSFGDPTDFTKPRLLPSWVGNDALVAPRGGSPSPYQFQDGWYLLPAR